MIDEELRELFNSVRMVFGHSIRKVELTDETLCELLKIALGHYESEMFGLLLETSWQNFFGKDLTQIDVMRSMSLRSLDLSLDFSSWYSKEASLSGRGIQKNVLNKDFFLLEKGKTAYQIPPNRIIKKVLWITPPHFTRENLMMANNFGIGEFGSSYAQIGGSSQFMGGAGYFGRPFSLTPFADMALNHIDQSYKRDYLNTQKHYRVTNLEDGSKLIHLSNMALDTSDRYDKCVCWYEYYDGSDADIMDCLKQDPNIILHQHQVPFTQIPFGTLNSPTQSIVKQLLIGYAAETLSFIRGTFSGNINMINSSLTMDYSMFRQYGESEKTKAIETLRARVSMLSPHTQMQRNAEIAENMMRIKKYKPLPIFVH